MVNRTIVAGRHTWPDDYTDSNNGADRITGSPDADFINGGFGNDDLRGFDGDDVLNGGRGGDDLRGGNGFDIFVYNNLLDSPVSNPDEIVDFIRGEDVLDLEAIDADVTTPDNQDFLFIKDAAFSGAAGELRIDDFNSVLQGDVDGDGAADFVIDFRGDVPIGGQDVAFDLPEGEEGLEIIPEEGAEPLTLNTDLLL